MSGPGVFSMTEYERSIFTPSGVSASDLKSEAAEVADDRGAQPAGVYTFRSGYSPLRRGVAGKDGR